MFILSTFQNNRCGSFGCTLISEWLSVLCILEYIDRLHVKSHSKITYVCDILRIKFDKTNVLILIKWLDDMIVKIICSLSHIRISRYYIRKIRCNWLRLFISVWNQTVAKSFPMARCVLALISYQVWPSQKTYLTNYR